MRWLVHCICGSLMADAYYADSYGYGCGYGYDYGCSCGCGYLEL
jgi:hypothetical protein